MSIGFDIGFRIGGVHGGRPSAGVAAPDIDVGMRVDFVGDSITHGGNGWAARNFFIAAINSRLETGLGADQGVVADTTTLILARIAEILALKSDVVWFWAGTNDAFAGVALATVIANFNTFCSAVLGNGTRAIIMPTPLIRSGLSGANETIRAGIRSHILARTDVVPVDMEGVITNFSDTAQLADGTHPTARKAKVGGELIASTFASRIKAGSILFADAAAATAAGNLEPDWNFAGVGGTKNGAGSTPTGELADGWTLNNATTATVVCSKVTLNGAVAQRITISGTVSVEGNLLLSTVSSAFTVVAGESFNVHCDHVVTAGDGVSAPVGIRGYIVGSAGLGRIFHETTDTGYGPYDFVQRGVVRNTPAPLQSGGALTSTMTMRLLAGAVDIQIDIAKWGVIKAETVARGLPHIIAANSGAFLPVITGTLTNGSTLTCSSGAWGGGGITLTYQWYRSDNAPIVGATARTWVAVTGLGVYCIVTATNTFGATPYQTPTTAVIS